MSIGELERPVKSAVIEPLSMRRRVKNHVARIFFLSSFVVALVPLGWVLAVVIGRGWYAVTRPGWWTRSLRGVLPEEFAGGVYHALYGTLVQAGVATVLAVPLGLMTAVLLVEYGSGRLARLTTFMVDVLAGVPSIVAALFIFSLWIVTLGFDQSAFAVSLALVLLMLPVVVRSSEEMLRLVPDELREASYALGIRKWTTIVRIVIPMATPGIVSGVLLGISRIIGETAPVLVLVGYSRSINFDISEGNMASLPLLIYTELANPEHAGFLRVWGAALTLIILVAAINLTAAAIRFLATRQQQGRAGQSRRDGALAIRTWSSTSRALSSRRFSWPGSS
jgi:phosphate transport system permease protein